MSNTYIPKHFAIEELLPPPVFLPDAFRKAYQQSREKLFRLFDYRVLVTLDRLRERYGVCTVNNWHFFDASAWNDLSVHMFRFSGWRPFDCPEGVELSEHKFFRAMDCKFKHTTPPEIWAELRKNKNAPEFEFIQRIEAFEGMSWFHFDMGQHGRYDKAVKVLSGKVDRAGLPQFVEKVA
ncbi:hypothetical protein [Halodesulfovibrio sp.]|uniref:hypothetical protein n=1 Tax=Halodesulfovibrio sp. TaxID=1912772 RepID=UPI0025C3E31E|nr:hypothetical protein [Halodesulfovibrio sp.]